MIYFWPTYPWKAEELPHLSNQGERCWLQYTFVNPLETEADWFIETRFVKKYMSHGSILKKYWF